LKKNKIGIIFGVLLFLNISIVCFTKEYNDDVKFYAYDNAQIKSVATLMRQKGDFDSEVQKSIEKYFFSNNLEEEKVVNGKIIKDVPWFKAIPLSLASKTLLPEPNEKLWGFYYNDLTKKSDFIGTTAPTSFGCGFDGWNFLFFSYNVNDLKMNFRSEPNPGIVFVSVPLNTSPSQLPKAFDISKSLKKRFLDILFQEKAKKNFSLIRIEGGIQVIDKKYIVAGLYTSTDRVKEIYEIKANDEFLKIYVGYYFETF